MPQKSTESNASCMIKRPGCPEPCSRAEIIQSVYYISAAWWSFKCVKQPVAATKFKSSVLSNVFTSIPSCGEVPLFSEPDRCTPLYLLWLCQRSQPEVEKQAWWRSAVLEKSSRRLSKPKRCENLELFVANLTKALETKRKKETPTRKNTGKERYFWASNANRPC